MKLCSPGRARCNLLAALFFLFQLTAFGQTKRIRLRDETIVTPPKGKTALAQSPAARTPATGLFLVQFESPPSRASRAELRSMGVELLKYVPDDAFIARFNNVTPESVQALSDVRWVGPYLPTYKVGPRLSAAVHAAQPANHAVAVDVLLSPKASPVAIAAVRALLAPVRNETQLRQGIILRGELPPGRLKALTPSSAVLWVEPAPQRKLVDEAASKLIGGDDGLTGTPTVTEQLGYGGAGVTVCVADTGLDTGDTNTMHPDLRGRVKGFLYYGSLTDGSDGYGHGTHCAGIIAGDAATGERDPDTGGLYGLGVASQASLLIERIFDENANEVSPFPSDATLTEDAVRNGAQIGANSWGNDVQGEYDIDAAQFDELVRDADPSTPGDQPYILEFSAGNAGPQSETMDSPACAKNVIATGASENVPGTLALTYGLYADGQDTIADFSSRGPCQDGRIKPDLVAPGTWIASLASSAALNESSIAWSTIDNYYVYMGGTSMSGPFAAGAAADFVQFYKATHTNAMPSPALVKAALINSADELDQANGGPGPVPNFDEGWGRITLTNIIRAHINNSPRFYQYLDQSVLLTDGGTYVQHTFVQSPDQPLKVTMAYTDVPGFPGAIPALVNDLDLEVVAPDGTLYRGNEFAAGESVPNPPAADHINNVEGIYLSHPEPGNYLVRVRGTHIVQDARLDTTAIDQDFALVTSGDLVRPGRGIVLLDRTNYTAPGIINVEVLDPARAGSSSVNVILKSTTEPLGETYILNSAGSFGAFTDAVATVVGAAAVDGKLEIHNGDSIEADYVNTSGETRTASAVAQLIPPVVSAVTAGSDLGIITISWQTSEPADSVVRFSSDLTFNQAATNLTLTTAHVIKLRNLVPGQTYYFYVVSTDAAGNTTTNNNSGAYYSFVAVAPPTVLLVDDYDSAGEAQDGSTVIPDSAYTNALAATGYRYAFWKVTQRGAPQLSDLQGFPVVIWRTTDDIINYTGTNYTLTPQQQYMIESYLDGGGSFFMASMNILSQLGDVPFRQDVFHVGGYVQNPDPPAPCSDCDEDYGVPAAVGATGDPITGGMGITLDYTNYPVLDLGLGPDFVFGPDFSDTFTPTTNATPIFYEAASGKPCGMCYPQFGVKSAGRVVFLSFPLDAVPASGSSPDNETVLLRNILRFLAPGANGVGTVQLGSTAYTLPDQVTVEVGDSDLAGAGQTQVTFTSSSAPGPVTVTLHETPHPGLFLGTLVLVATNAASGQLIAQNGDTVTATYFDASNNSNVVATATVDTTPPVISQVSATTQSGSALVTWNTSKPADSLVQYGESALPDRAAYSGQLVTTHAVTVSGLSANRVYYYQVASRDAAGNTAVDDNQGALYSFQTLQAARPPWFDDFEGGTDGWTVAPDPSGSDINWQLGTPDNGLATSAYSGTNAWGSDLYGTNFDIADSYLYSPPIDLTGMSQATLTFWDNYDFTSLQDLGQILILTNSSTAPSTLNPVLFLYGDASYGWEQETVDLTPYVGQTIQILWNYQGVTSTGPLDGWLVDDVSVTGVTGSGTVVVDKNLGQGSFTLTGPTGQSTGTLPTTTISNEPPGEYTVQFGDVPFYRTPAAESNNLADGGTLTFTGTYSFIDANLNGISDAWEDYYFGTASTNHTRLTDTDGDGMTDYAEFIAGTNPTNAESNLRFLSMTRQPNGQVKFQWSAVPGRIYELQSTTASFQSWQPVTGQLQATGSPMSYTTTNLSNGAHLFRVEVWP